MLVTPLLHQILQKSGEQRLSVQPISCSSCSQLFWLPLISPMASKLNLSFSSAPVLDGHGLWAFPPLAFSAQTFLVIFGSWQAASPPLVLFLIF